MIQKSSPAKNPSNCPKGADGGHWWYLRSNWLSNRVFDTYEAIIEAACEAWRNLTARPDRITSIGTRQWVHIGQER